MNKNEVLKLSKSIFEELRRRDIDSVISLISKELKKEKTNKLQITKTLLLNSIGKELGKLLTKEEWWLERLTELWRKSKRDEKLIVISALGEISKKDYKNSKQFVLNLLKDISDWEICDQLALRVIVNLAVQNQKEIFSLMHKWIKSKQKWIRRLTVATTPPYIRAEKTESKVCLELLDEAMKEEDKDVKKAIGWALREVTKKDQKSVLEFLQKWAKIEDKNTKWIVKEGMKKLAKEDQEKLKSIIGD